MTYKKRLQKWLLSRQLPPLKPDERVYLNVPYKARDYAKTCHCGFDGTRKLWFTGLNNRWLRQLVELYGVNTDATSDEVKKRLMEIADGQWKDYP